MKIDNLFEIAKYLGIEYKIDIYNNCECDTNIYIMNRFLLNQI